MQEFVCTRIRAPFISRLWSKVHTRSQIMWSTEVDLHIWQISAKSRRWDEFCASSSSSAICRPSPSLEAITPRGREGAGRSLRRARKSSGERVLSSRGYECMWLLAVRRNSSLTESCGRQGKANSAVLFVSYVSVSTTLTYL
jgi:hypothetical protein